MAQERITFEVTVVIDTDEWADCGEDLNHWLVEAAHQQMQKPKVEGHTWEVTNTQLQQR